ncbi:BPL-N domain-containing protein [Bacillus rubiinfantis]|uniref:BPL-N domain-containing protein n=1 Tax=Bacillus rubiinfantis TaxID=1499680 RepID=UPI0005A744A7|nr:BPL-N domain-containing protein [Bacillus rubiinfantis]
MYTCIPMTRLGLETYQSDISSIYTQVNQLLYEGKKVFQVKETFRSNTKRFPEGHFIFPGSLLIEETEGFESISMDELEGELDETKVAPLNLKRRIAFLDGKNCAPFCSDPFYHFFNAYGLKVERITDLEVRDGILKEVDVLIVPGGPDAGESYYEGLGEKGYDEIRSFVARGGGYLGSCAGSYFPLSGEDDHSAQDMWLNMVPVTDQSGLDYWRTGTGFVRIEFDDVTHPITFGLAMGRPSTVDMIYWEGPAFHLLDDKDVHVIASYKDFIASGKEPPSWNLEKNPIAQEAMKWANPLTKQRFTEHLQGVPAIIEAPFGNGHMVLISPHAEFGTCGTEHEMKNNPNYLLLMNSLYYLSGMNGQ